MPLVYVRSLIFLCTEVAKLQLATCGVHEDLIILGNLHPFPHYLSNEVPDHVPLREGYQGDDYQVGIICYDSNIIKYQLLVYTHLI